MRQQLGWRGRLSRRNREANKFVRGENGCGFSHRFRLLLFGDLLAHRARMLTVERPADAFSHSVARTVINHHACPCHDLHQTQRADCKRERKECRGGQAHQLGKNELGADE